MKVGIHSALWAGGLLYLLPTVVFDKLNRGVGFRWLAWEIYVFRGRV